MDAISARTPRDLGYRWPAEWEPHEATWLAWPHKESSWPGKLDRIPPIFVEAVRALLPGEAVRILVRSPREEADVRALLRRVEVDGGVVETFVVPTDDAWIRDHGPIFVVRDGADPLAVTDWGYNAWGGKYPPWDQDVLVAQTLARQLAVPRFAPGMILEGGSIDGDGEGTLLTTESCLLHPNRNPDLTRAQIEERLRQYLGIETVLWLGDGIVGDDTDGHVDDLTRFVAPGVVVTVLEDDATDPNFAPLAENLRRLQTMTDARGRSLEVRTLPMPRPVWEGSDRLPASYANFYVGNAAVLVPTFDDPADERALAELERCFPGRRIVGIGARDLVWGLGAFHCLTQQQPRVAGSSPRG